MDVIILKYKAVLFDLDGTLLDTLDDLANSMNAVLARRGFKTHDRELYRYFVGNGMEKLVRRTLPAAYSGEGIVRDALLEVSAEYENRWCDCTRPYEGVHEMLDALTAKGLRLAVLSNKPDGFTKKIIDHFFGGIRFDAVFGARDGVPKKPDPAAALEIAALMGIPPADFLYLGDTDVDMKTALAAGMHPIGALWGFREEEELRRGGAEKLISCPSELLHLL